MDEVMSKAIAEPRKQVSEYAPKIVQIQIDPEKIGDVVGQRGKTINEIIARTGVKIDITDDGSVSVCGTEAEMMDKAIEMIRIITTDFKEGQILTGNGSEHQGVRRILRVCTGQRRHGSHQQDRKGAHQPCGGCTDPWR